MLRERRLPVARHPRHPDGDDRPEDHVEPLADRQDLSLTSTVKPRQRSWSHRVAIAVLATVSMAAALSAMATRSPATSSWRTARGDSAGPVSIGGGRKLYLRCAGRGSPTVILESGIHDSSDPWTLTDTRAPALATPSVFAGVARYAHVCMDDRPGTIRYTNPPALTTRSTPVRTPRTVASMVADLHRLLTRARIPGPYLLVAHSYGGLIVRLFAQTYPAEIAGLVLVDAFGINIRHLFGPRLWPRYVRLLNHPGTSLDRQPGFETVNVDSAITTIKTARALPRVALAVISKTEPFATAPTVPQDLTLGSNGCGPQSSEPSSTSSPKPRRSWRLAATTTFRSTIPTSRSARSC